MERKTNKVTVDGRTIHVSKFHNINSARSWATRGSKPAWVVMGDVDDVLGKYWVCRPVDAERLSRAGYQII